LSLACEWVDDGITRCSMGPQDNCRPCQVRTVFYLAAHAKGRVRNYELERANANDPSMVSTNID